MPWFVFGGGKYTFFTLAYQAKLYGGLALTNPYHNGFGIILPATLANVVKKSLPVWADLFMISKRIVVRDAGLSEPGHCLCVWFCGLVSRYPLRFRPVAGGGRTNGPSRRHGSGWPCRGLLVAGFAFYSVPSARLVVAAALPLLYYLLYRAFVAHGRPSERRFLYLLLLLSTVPTLVLIAFAFKNGHTYGITQRYSGFSFPYTLILVGLIVQQAFRQPAWLRLTLGAVLLIQTYFIGDLLYRIYEDDAPKYTYFGYYRMANPYNTAAKRIKKLYAPGDTVLYPSARTAPRDEIENPYTRHSIIDAQYTNLYLPKDATYYQRMDTTQTDRIILVKGKSGQRITIFDFEGQKYRY